MKQLIVKCTLLVMLAVGFSATTNAQRIYVKVQPAPRAVVVRPAAPHRNYIWVDGEYVRRGRGYVYREGYWAAPRVGRAWVPGHWIKERRGWYWVPGFWRRA